MRVGDIVTHKLKPDLKMIIVSKSNDYLKVRYWHEQAGQFLYQEFSPKELSEVS